MAGPSQKATAFIFSLAAVEQGWTDTPTTTRGGPSLPINCLLGGCSVLLPFFSGPVDDGGRSRRVEEPVTALLTHNPVQNVSKHATALPGDLGEDLCPQLASLASSRHKRMHSCSEKLTGQEIVRLPYKQTKGPDDNV